MEEGPEPQEWIEKTAHQHHEQQHHGPPDKAAVHPPAITAAILAVLAAIGSLLSGHAANEAILKRSEANDQWGYYQSTSTKGHIYEGNRELVDVLTAGGVLKSDDKTKATLKKFADQKDKYDEKKNELGARAKELEDESDHEYRKHRRYAGGVAAFQVGIVLASIFILVRYRALFLLSLVAGAVGIVFLAVGFFI